MVIKCIYIIYINTYDVTLKYLKFKDLKSLSVISNIVLEDFSAELNIEFELYGTLISLIYLKMCTTWQQVARPEVSFD